MSNMSQYLHSSNFSHIDQPYVSEHLDCINISEGNRIRHFSLATRIIFGAWLVLIALGAVIGNLMVIIVILINRYRRGIKKGTGTNYFLMSLAIADMMVGLFVVPQALHTFLRECWSFGSLMCLLTTSCISIIVSTSIHTLMYLAIFKYINIKRCAKTINYKPITRCMRNLMIILPYIWGLILAVLATKFLSSVKLKPKTIQCGPEYPSTGNTRLYILHVANQFLNIILPTVIIIFTYLKIYSIIKRDAWLRDNSLRAPESEVLKTFFIVLVCFLLCWTPYFVYTNYVTIIPNKDDIPVHFNLVAFCFGYSNSACNPIIYAWRFPEFRMGYQYMLQRQRRRSSTATHMSHKVIRPSS
ncbi:beta-2 adrenergic receptor-like [Mizuhopecten yessoensis]|uniref:beta-2 adrenergic receptor-like n=1 Tax=Mizuhopecten yessoensis TaxID=6573 RepID=UPI000B45C975|nr:beta-2 adrenergic receptor-like [Mizuhopecten yessoensis]